MLVPFPPRESGGSCPKVFSVSSVCCGGLSNPGSFCKYTQTMKRDMELIRLLLLEKEQDSPPPELADYDEQLVVYQIALMIDAGLVVGEVLPDRDGTPRGAVVVRLTWAGHEFLDSLRDPTIWQSAKDKVLKPGASWTFGILAEFAKQEAMRRLGLLVP